MNGNYSNCRENSTFLAGEIFSEKGNIFRGISFFSLFPEFPEISTLTGARLLTVVLPRKNGNWIDTVCVFTVVGSFVLANVLEHNCNPVGENELSFVVVTFVYLLLV